MPTGCWYMMQARGYPMAVFDRRYEDLTVDHAEVARHYREGNLLVRRQARGEATTEDLRQALKHTKPCSRTLSAMRAPMRNYASIW